MAAHHIPGETQPTASPENAASPLPTGGSDTLTKQEGGARRPFLRLTTDSWFYVPSDQLARYSSCSGVKRSILMPSDSSLSLATRLSSSSGTGIDLLLQRA